MKMFLEYGTLLRFAECAFERYSASGMDSHSISSMNELGFLAAGKKKDKISPKPPAEGDCDFESLLTTEEMECSLVRGRLRAI